MADYPRIQFARIPACASCYVVSLPWLLRTALRARDAFGRYLAVGVTTMIVVQAFFNISMVLALLQTKGIPLPFISYGGSSLFVMLASVGVLLSVSQQTE
jgi:cell division protein FtsW